MDTAEAVAALAALAQDTRLKAFRLLVQAGPGGVCAGDVARALDVPANTLSFHLSQLATVGLVRQRRDGRSIVYAADFGRMDRLLGFLSENCCGGRPEICATGPARSSCTDETDRQRAVSMTPNNRSTPYNVLFLCTGNSARSILAEAALQRWGNGKFNAFSAGSQPKGQVHPVTLTTLAALNFKTDGFRSKSWDEFAGPEAPQLDFVFTVCDNAANEVCPIWPGQPMSAHWGIYDPAAATGTERQIADTFRRAYFELESRIKIFANLRIEGLDRLSLQSRLKEIGTTTSASEHPAA